MKVNAADVMRKPCSGAGKAATDARWRTAICPVCRGIANVDERVRIEPHTVLVIDA